MALLLRQKGWKREKGKEVMIRGEGMRGKKRGDKKEREGEGKKGEAPKSLRHCTFGCFGSLFRE